MTQLMKHLLTGILLPLPRWRLLRFFLMIVGLAQRSAKRYSFCSRKIKAHGFLAPSTRNRDKLHRPVCGERADIRLSHLKRFGQGMCRRKRKRMRKESERRFGDGRFGGGVGRGPRVGGGLCVDAWVVWGWWMVGFVLVGGQWREGGWLVGEWALCWRLLVFR